MGSKSFSEASGGPPPNKTLQPLKQRIYFSEQGHPSATGSRASRIRASLTEQIAFWGTLGPLLAFTWRRILASGSLVVPARRSASAMVGMAAATAGIAALAAVRDPAPS
jgi:hypothetical protein